MQIHIERNERIPYTGAELRSHFLRERFGIRSSAMVAFRGEAHVPTAHLVDLDDREANDSIVAKDMVHVLAEWFDEGRLFPTVLKQLLIVSLLADQLRALLPEVRIERKGDDLFIEERKLTVSICARSVVSHLMHIGINVDSTGAPVKAIGLSELGLGEEEVMKLVENWLEGARQEFAQAEFSCTKVLPVM